MIFAGRCQTSATALQGVATYLITRQQSHRNQRIIFPHFPRIPNRRIRRCNRINIILPRPLPPTLLVRPISHRRQRTSHNRLHQELIRRTSRQVRKLKRRDEVPEEELRRDLIALRTRLPRRGRRTARSGLSSGARASRGAGGFVFEDEVVEVAVAAAGLAEAGAALAAGVALVAAFFRFA